MVVCEYCDKKLPESVLICPDCKGWTTQPMFIEHKSNHLVSFYRTGFTLAGMALFAAILIWIALYY